MQPAHAHTESTAADAAWAAPLMPAHEGQRGVLLKLAAGRLPQSCCAPPFWAIALEVELWPSLLEEEEEPAGAQPGSRENEAGHMGASSMHRVDAIGSAAAAAGRPRIAVTAVVLHALSKAHRWRGPQQRCRTLHWPRTAGW
jgi:hypothetical protein